MAAAGSGRSESRRRAASSCVGPAATTKASETKRQLGRAIRIGGPLPNKTAADDGSRGDRMKQCGNQGDQLFDANGFEIVSSRRCYLRAERIDGSQGEAGGDTNV